MNKIKKIKELKTNVKISEENFKDELAELKLQTLDLIVIMTEDLDLKIINRNTTNFMYIKPQDVEPFYKFLKEIFEEKGNSLNIFDAGFGKKGIDNIEKSEKNLNDEKNKIK